MIECKNGHDEHCWHDPQFDIRAVVNEQAFCCRCDARVVSGDNPR